MLKFTLPYITKSVKTMSKFSKLFGFNSLYSGKHWSLRKRDSEYWHALVKSELSKQGIKPGIYTKPVALTFYWNDRMDCTNHAYVGKMIEDALKGYLIADDSRKYVKRVVHEFYDGDCITVKIEVFQ